MSKAILSTIKYDTDLVPPDGSQLVRVITGEPVAIHSNNGQFADATVTRNGGPVDGWIPRDAYVHSPYNTPFLMDAPNVKAATMAVSAPGIRSAATAHSTDLALMAATHRLLNAAVSATEMLMVHATEQSIKDAREGKGNGGGPPKGVSGKPRKRKP